MEMLSTFFKFFYWLEIYDGAATVWIPRFLIPPKVTSNCYDMIRCCYGGVFVKRQQNMIKCRWRYDQILIKMLTKIWSAVVVKSYSQPYFCSGDSKTSWSSHCWPPWQGLSYNQDENQDKVEDWGWRQGEDDSDDVEILSRVVFEHSTNSTTMIIGTTLSSKLS